MKITPRKILFYYLIIISCLCGNRVIFASECFWRGSLELVGPMFGLPPGTGYALTGQLDKALLIGGSRLIAGNQYLQAIKSDSYQKKNDDVYYTTNAEDSVSGKNETEIYMNQSTWNANLYNTLYANLKYLSLWDLYEHNCQPNTETYDVMWAPFNFAHFYQKWEFWLPMLGLALNYANFNNTEQITAYLGNGLTRSQLSNEGSLMYYSVGIGEELLFRGTVQKSLYNYFKEQNFSPETSRLSSIFLTSAMFGLAHSGEGFSANTAQAFIFGLYQGFVYQPSVEEFDLITAIAIHSWLDLIVFYTVINHADVIETKEPVNVPVMNISFRF